MYWPSSVVLELTYKCNHKCVFCSCPWDAPNSSYPKGVELVFTQWKEIITGLYDKGVKTFSISGGEAILHPDIEQILRHIREEGCRRGVDYPITLISNGRALSKELLVLFKELNVHLSISLPGYETFSKHTGVDNAEKILYWFREAKALGLNTTVNVTVTKLNIHELFETISMALINGASSVLINRFLPGGRGLSYMKELTLDHKQLNEMLDTTEDVLRMSNRKGSVGTEFPLCIIDNLQKYKHLSVGTQCAAAKLFFVVGPSGEIRVCNHSPHIVGNILLQDPIIDKTYWNDFARYNYKPEMCRTCNKMRICDCGCREVANILTGSYRNPDPCID